MDHEAFEQYLFGSIFLKKINSLFLFLFFFFIFHFSEY